MTIMLKLFLAVLPLLAAGPVNPADLFQINVRADGTGDFTTLQEALDHVPDFSEATIFVTLAEGDYYGPVLCRNKSNLYILGAGKDRTRMHNDGDAAFTFDNCSDITVQDITFETSPGARPAGIMFRGERIALYGVRITGGNRAFRARGSVYVQDSEIDGGITKYSTKSFAAEVWEPVRPQVIKVWPEGAPDSTGLTGSEYRNANFRITNVTEATLTVFPAAHPNGQAVVACPGGGYVHLAFEHEASMMAKWYNEQGITLAVLKYRMPNGHYDCPLNDLKKAMKIMHDHASEWGVDPDMIGVQGGSAGGHLIARLATEYEDEIQRPAFQIVFYPALGMIPGDEKAIVGKVNGKTPRAFILCSQDDRISVTGSLDYMAALKAANVPSTLHIYSSGGHGWGFKDTFVFKPQWTSELAAWLRQINQK